MKPRSLPLADSALLVHFGDEIDPAVNQRVHGNMLCLHGDNARATANARLVREALAKAGIEVEALQTP